MPCIKAFCVVSQLLTYIKIYITHRRGQMKHSTGCARPSGHPFAALDLGHPWWPSGHQPPSGPVLQNLSGPGKTAQVESDIKINPQNAGPKEPDRRKPDRKENTL